MSKLKKRVIEIVEKDKEKRLAQIIGNLGADGAQQAVQNLSKAFEVNSWINSYIDKQYIESIHEYAVPGKLWATHHKSAGVNPLRGKLRQNEILATFAERTTTLNKDCIAISSYLRCLLVLWHMRQSKNNNATVIVPPALRPLCAKVRQITRGSIPGITFELIGPPELLLDKIIEQSVSEFQPFNKCQKGLRVLRDEIFFRTAEVLLNQDNYSHNKNKNPEVGNRKDSVSFKRDGYRVFTKNYSPDNSEPSFQSLIALPEEKIGELEEVSRLGRSARLKAAKYRSEMDNQYLPYCWNALSIKEIKLALQFALTSEDINPVERLIFAITLFMAASPKDIEGVSFVEVIDQDAQNLQISLSQKVWAHSYPNIYSKFHASDKQSEFLADNSSLVIQPLPLEVHNVLKKSIPEIDTNSSSWSTEVLTTYLKVVCQKASLATGMRITSGRLRSALFFIGMYITNDSMLMNHTLSNDEFAPSVEDYYYSVESEVLSNNYKLVCESLGVKCSEFCNYRLTQRNGSELYFMTQSHQLLLEDCLKRLGDLKKRSITGGVVEVINYHNLYASFTAWMLWCAIGIRPRKFFPINIHNIDGEWVIVDEKSKPYPNARIVRVSSFCKQQLSAYLDHLKSLAVFLKLHNQSIYKKISLIRVPSMPLNEISLFFSLKNVKEVQAQELTSQFILKNVGIPDLLPNNLARHWFVSGPRQYGIPAEWIAAASGHIQCGQRAWGMSSPIAPSNKDYIRIWDDGIEAWLNELGFNSIEYGLQSKGRVNSLSLREAGCSFLELPSKQEPRYKVRDIVRKAISHVLKNNANTDIYLDASAQDAVVDQIHKLCNESAFQLQHAHNLFLRYIDVKSKGSGVGSRFSYYLSGEPDASNFRETDLVLLKFAKEIRANIFHRIEDFFDGASIVEKYAWFALVLIFHEGLLRESSLKILFGNLKQFLYRTNHNNCWIEWEEDGRLNRRIISFETIILVSAFKDASIPSWVAISKAIEKNLLKFPIKTGIFKRSISDIKLEYILRVAAVWYRFQVPGSICAYLLGDVKCSSVPAPNFIGLIDGNPRKSPIEISKCTDNVKYFVAKVCSENCSISSDKFELNRLKNAVKQLLSPNEKSTDDGKVKSSYKAVYQDLDDILSSWIQDKRSSLLITLGMYAQFLVSKKIKSSHLKPKTIDDYIREVGIPLIEICSNLDWVTLDEDELENIYIDVLDYSSSSKRRERVAKRIVYFHLFCVNTIGLPNINFATLDSAFFSSTNAFVHARILPYASYLKLLELLAKSYENRSEILLVTLALILMFRFKLRLGEVMARTTSEIQIDGNKIIVWVRTNKLGKPKSSAGKRQVLNWYLEDFERTVIERRIGYLKSQFANQECALFSAPNNPWQLTSRAMLSKQLLHVLKMVSGDPEFRSHHARHTNASAINLEIICGVAPKGIQGWLDSSCGNFQKMILGTSIPSRRSTYALANQMGHRSISTTFESYTHTLDFATYYQISNLRLDSLSYNTLSFLLNVSNSSLRKANSRLKDRDAFELFVLKNHLDIEIFKEINFESVDLDAVTEIDLPDIKNILSLDEMERFLIALDQGRSLEELSKLYPIDFEKALRLKNLHHRFSSELNFCFSDFVKRTQISKSSNESIKHRLRVILERESIKKEAVSAIGIWSRNYHAPLKGLSIINHEERLLFLSWMNRLPAVIKSQIHTSDKNFNELQKMYESLMINVEIVVNKYSYRSDINIRGKTHQAPQIFISFNEQDTKKKTSLMPTFHLLMYLSFLRSQVYSL